LEKRPRKEAKEGQKNLDWGSKEECPYIRSNRNGEGLLEHAEVEKKTRRGIDSNGRSVKKDKEPIRIRETTGKRRGHINGVGKLVEPKDQPGSGKIAREGIAKSRSVVRVRDCKV